MTLASQTLPFLPLSEQEKLVSRPALILEFLLNFLATPLILKKNQNQFQEPVLR